MADERTKQAASKGSESTYGPPGIDFEGERMDFGGRVQEFRTATSRKLNDEWLTDIGGRAGRTRLYSAVDEAFALRRISLRALLSS